MTRRTEHEGLRILSATTHYEVLSLPVGANAEQIKAAHRTLARRFHPDLCSLARAHDVMSRVNQAYACLSDKDARRLYDTVNKTAAGQCAACSGSGHRFKQQGFGKKVRVPCATCGGSGQC